MTTSNNTMSKGSKMAIVIGILAVVAVASVVIASYQFAPSNSNIADQQENQSSITTGKKVTIDLNENLGLKEKP